MKLQAPPVKRIALAHDIPVFQPVTLKDGTALEEIRQLSPELIVVAAYGRLLPREILELPANGCINVHSSLRPQVPGGCPQSIGRVLNGEEETGVTIMYMAQELDAGDIIAQASTPIDPEETVESVHDRLAGLAPGCWSRQCPGWRPERRSVPPRTGNGPPMRPCFPGSSLPLIGPARPVRSTTRSGG